MRHARLTIVMLVLGIGVLGAYFGVRGQDPRLPWPPAPVRPPGNFEESEPPPRTVSRLPSPPPVTPPEIPAPGPLAPASFETKSMVPPNLPSAGPVIVDVAPDAPPLPPTPAIQSKPKSEPAAPALPVAQGPVIIDAPEEKVGPPPTVSPLPNFDSKRNKVTITTIPAPPSTRGSSPPPVPQGSPGQQMPPDLIIIPDRSPVNVPSVPAPSVPEPAPVAPAFQVPTPSTPTPIIPTPLAPAPTTSFPSANVQPRPKAFQLVNPIRSKGNEVTDMPPSEPFPMPERRMISAQPVAQTNPSASSANIVGAATPQVTVEKRGPANRRGGEPLQFYIILRNIGSSPASDVRVEDDIPPGTRFSFGDPEPLLQNGRAVWVVPHLPPGAEKQLKIELQAQGSGDVVGATTVTVVATTGSRSRLAQGKDGLTLVVKAPASVPNGFPVVFEAQVTNHGKEALDGLMLHVNLPDGLTHEFGKAIEAPLNGVLSAGATKSYKVPLTAVQPGRQTIEVRISAKNGMETSGIGTVQVTPVSSTGVSVQQTPQVKLFLDKEADLRIDVTNTQGQYLQNVMVLDTLPAGVQFVSASDRGLYRPDARTAHWLVENLAPGQTRTLTVRVKPEAAGQFDNEVVARTEAQQDIHSKAKVHVHGIADLVLTVTDRDNPIELGKATEYEIKVVNQGNAAATGVQVKATLPPGMIAKLVRGPSVHELDGKQVVFASLPRLQPQGQAVYYVSALAQAPGDQRFRAQVVSDQAVVPISREERTFVYQD